MVDELLSRIEKYKKQRAFLAKQVDGGIANAKALEYLAELLKQDEALMRDLVLPQTMPLLFGETINDLRRAATRGGDSQAVLSKIMKRSLSRQSDLEAIEGKPLRDQVVSYFFELNALMSKLYVRLESAPDPELKQKEDYFSLRKTFTRHGIRISQEAGRTINNPLPSSQRRPGR